MVSIGHCGWKTQGIVMQTILFSIVCTHCSTKIWFSIVIDFNQCCVLKRKISCTEVSQINFPYDTIV